MRLAYKQPSFSRYAYAGEDQCLSPPPHNGDLSEEAKEKIRSGKTSRVDGAKEVLQKNAKEKRRRSARRRAVEMILQSDLQT